MRVQFPAMKGFIGRRQYYATVIALSEIPHLFKFNDWAEVTPELRAQRVLNTPRIPEIAKYIIDNEDGYIFSSITASFDTKGTEITFTPINGRSDVGTIEMELERAEFVINDGQHRCAAIAHALKDNPNLGKEQISVLLFPMESVSRLQQMFSDLNRFVRKTSKSLDILYDHRDWLASLTMDVSEEVNVFQGMVDKERITLPIRSPKMFTLSMLYDANQELFDGQVQTGARASEAMLKTAVDYWTQVAKCIPDWKAVKDGNLQATQLRQEKLSSHSVVMRALGGLGRVLLKECPDDWRERLDALRSIDWRKAKGSTVNPTWENVCIVAGSVVSNRQARAATFGVLTRVVDVGQGGVEPRRRGKGKRQPRKTTKVAVAA